MKAENTIFPEGSYYKLPEGFTWERVFEEKKDLASWEDKSGVMPLSAVQGFVVAWGKVLPSDYKIWTED